MRTNNMEESKAGILRDWQLNMTAARSGYYADPPYLNISEILRYCVETDYHLKANLIGSRCAELPIGNVEVESHCIVRRRPFTVVAGMPAALDLLRAGAGHEEVGRGFLNGFDALTVFAVRDGEIVRYGGNPLEAVPVMVIRGRYRDFALLKTPMLGILARGSRVATNVYRCLVAAKGKPIYTFCARYDHPSVQGIDGYAYHIAVERFNRDYKMSLPDRVSTWANAEWFQGSIEGTISHEAIACFLGSSADLMVKFAEILPPEHIRVALVDFNNDCVTDTAATMKAMFDRYRALYEAGNHVAAERFRLNGIRLDTSKELIDRSLSDSCTFDERGVSLKLVMLLRGAIDAQWEKWALPESWRMRAKEWCRGVKIMVSGGFTEERIRAFEEANAPVDCYGVGSALLRNDDQSITDYSSVVMKVKVGDEWCDIPKVGRRSNENPNLELVR